VTANTTQLVTESSATRSSILDLGFNVRRLDTGIQKSLNDINSQINESARQQLVLQNGMGKAQQTSDNILSIVVKLLLRSIRGVRKLKDIERILHRIFCAFGTFTREMRMNMISLLEHARRTERMLSTVITGVPARVYLSVVMFRDALGKEWPLPYDLCIQRSSFGVILNEIFRDRQGRRRVESGQYLIMHASGRPIDPPTGQIPSLRTTTYLCR
jgi:hypothetical protein